MGKAKLSALQASERVRDLGRDLETTGRALARAGATLSDQVQALTDCRVQVAAAQSATRLVEAAVAAAAEAQALAEQLAAEQVRAAEQAAAQAEAGEPAAQESAQASA